MPRLAGLAVEQVSEAVMVVDEPITQAPEPWPRPVGPSASHAGWFPRSRPTAARTSSAP